MCCRSRVRVKSFGPNFERAGWIISGAVTVLMLLAMVFLAMFLRQPSAATPRIDTTTSSQIDAPSALAMPEFQPLDHMIEDSNGRKVVKSWLLVHGSPTRAQLDALMLEQFNEIRSRPYYIVNDTQNDVWIWAYGSQQDFAAKRNCLARLRKPFDLINPTIEYLPGTAEAMLTKVEVEPIKDE